MTITHRQLAVSIFAGLLLLSLFQAQANPMCTDVDTDGYAIEGGNCGEVDCDDSDAGVSPGAVDLPGNTTDENCDGSLGPCDPGAVWKNHGQFVSCTAQEGERLLEAGLITEEQKDAVVSQAAQSDVGKKSKKR